MSSKDESTAPGLLSKVVRFVKNPGTNWGDAEQEVDRESAYSKQMLKEMIERKRRNDFVRKREFDMLRKMRRSEALSGQDQSGRLSFFQSSMPSRPDDRAGTLKKIDEIEAQMSMQWWKTKHGVNGPQDANNTDNFMALSPRTPPSGADQAYRPTHPQEFAEALPSSPVTPAQAAVPKVAGASGDTVDPSTRMRARTAGAAAERLMPPLTASLSAGAMPVAATPVVAAPPPAPATDDASADGAASGFSASKLFAIDVDEFAHDPELEEVAIRFANGDDDGAEAGLLELLGPQGARVNHDETWLTLFDLCRATGRQERFEAAAIEFANRFGRSAPQWISLPDIVGRMGAPAAAGKTAIADWTSPASFGTQSLAALNAALGRAAPPWRLNWSKLTSIVDSAVEPLTKTFTLWASQAGQLRFIGADVLEDLLRQATPSGDRSVNPGWWSLRMEVMRVTHRPDEFELVALDYCVTYEVSPPSWESARCEYKPLAADGSYSAGHTIVGEAVHDSVMSGYGNFGDSRNSAYPETQQQQMASVVTVELAGQVLDDAAEALELLQAKMLGADVMLISCARLMRIDFNAAGTLLNWVSARAVEGRQVHFIEVHRLVAAFFNVIGINEHARVIARQD